MQPYAAEWLSIIPPIVAIGLALMTKEVFSSLLVGIFTGTLIYAVGTGGNIVMGTTEVAFKMMAQKLDFNIIIFCSLLGALVYVITIAGGTKAYGKAAVKLIKGRRSTLLATGGLGLTIFIDDYFNCLTVGTVMRPLTDLYRISREKLAYIIDSTAAPICIIAPISSWAAAVGSSLKDTGAFESELGAFVATIPWNFYALLCLILVVFICLTSYDFGPMRRAEINAQRDQELSEEGVQEVDREVKSNPRGTVWDCLSRWLPSLFSPSCRLCIPAATGVKTRSTTPLWRQSAIPRPRCRLCGLPSAPWLWHCFFSCRAGFFPLPTSLTAALKA